MVSTCHRCNKKCKSKRGLTNHMKACMKNLSGGKSNIKKEPVRYVFKTGCQSCNIGGRCRNISCTRFGR